MRTIVLYDTYEGGHHLMYLRLVSKTLLELGYRVVAFCPEPKRLSSWLAVNCTDKMTGFAVAETHTPQPISLPGVGRLPQPFNVLARWHHAAKTIAHARQLQSAPDLVFFNWVDDFLSCYLPAPLIDQIFPYAWGGLCFQPKLKIYPDQPYPKGLFEYHELFKTNHCRGIGVLDEEQALVLKDLTGKPVVAFPDVTDESVPDPEFSLVHQLKEEAQGRKIIGLLGSLNKRKGLLTLLKVAQQVQPKDYFFAFVGQLSPYMLMPEELLWLKGIVESPPKNCFFHLQAIPDEPQFNACVEACDILFAAYEGFPYSSNMLTKAAVFHKPVIVSNGFCMAKRVEQYHMGLTIPEGDVARCIEAIHSLCHGVFGGESSGSVPSPDFSRYRSRHSVLEVRRGFQELLDAMH